MGFFIKSPYNIVLIIDFSAFSFNYFQLQEFLTACKSFCIACHQFHYALEQ